MSGRVSPTLLRMYGDPNLNRQWREVGGDITTTLLACAIGWLMCLAFNWIWFQILIIFFIGAVVISCLREAAKETRQPRIEREFLADCFTLECILGGSLGYWSQAEVRKEAFSVMGRRINQVLSLEGQDLRETPDYENARVMVKEAFDCFKKFHIFLGSDSIGDIYKRFGKASKASTDESKPAVTYL